MINMLKIVFEIELFKLLKKSSSKKEKKKYTIKNLAKIVYVIKEDEIYYFG